MRVLVTGGAGFIGSYVVERLLGEEVRVGVVDDLSTGTLSSLDGARSRGLCSSAVFVEDVCSPSCVRVIKSWRPDVIVHLAAQSRVAGSLSDPGRDATTNVLGTVNVLDAARQAGVQRVVAASSGGTVYGHMPDGVRCTREAAARRPVSPYGVGKEAANGYLRVFRESFGLPTTTLLVGNVYGPRKDGSVGDDVTSRFVHAVMRGDPPVVCGDGEQTRDFVHVSDVAEAFLLACHSFADTEINVGTGVETSIGDLARLVCATLSAPIAVKYGAVRPGEVRRVCLDATRALKLLGWRPRFGMDAGVRDLAGCVGVWHAAAPVTSRGGNGGRLR